MELVNSDDCIRFYKSKMSYFSNKLGYSHINEYWLLIFSFIEYIYDCEGRSLIFQGFDFTKRKAVTSSAPYLHRWTQGYVNKLLHRLYKLDDIKIHHATMITMTTYQDSEYAKAKTGKSFSMVDSFEMLLKSRTKLIQMLRNMYGDVEYIWMLEPHKSGYPHCHMLVFKRLSPTDQSKLRNLWANKYGAGSFQRGLDFSEVTNIRRTRNYLMKYLKKSVCAVDLHSGTFDIRQLVYHAVAKEYGYRYYGCSSGVSQLMNFKLDVKDTDDIVWYKVGLSIKNDQWDENSADYYDCSISQKQYELALEKLERIKEDHVYLEKLISTGELDF